MFSESFKNQSPEQQGVKKQVSFGERQEDSNLIIHENGDIEFKVDGSFRASFAVCVGKGPNQAGLSSTQSALLNVSNTLQLNDSDEQDIGIPYLVSISKYTLADTKIIDSQFTQQKGNILRLYIENVLGFSGFGGLYAAAVTPPSPSAAILIERI